MSDHDEIRRFKWLMGFGLAMLISAYFSWGELKYAVWGKKAEAEITDVRETVHSGRRGRRIPMLEAEFRYTNKDGQSVTEREDFPVNWLPPSSGKMQVEYLSGEKDTARPAGQRQYLAMIVFFVCTAMVAGSIGKLWYEATHDNYQPKWKQRQSGARPRR